MFRYGLLGVSYYTDALTREEAMSYNCFWNPKLTGKVGHFDWHLPSLGQMSLLREGRIFFRDTPKQQSLEDWNDFWSDYKSA